MVEKTLDEQPHLAYYRVSQGMVQIDGDGAGPRKVPLMEA